MDQRDKRHQPALQAGGCQGGDRLVEPGQRVHEFRHPTGWKRAGVLFRLQLARHARRHFALQRQSGQVRCRLARPPAAQWCQYRSGGEQLDQLGTDRGRPSSCATRLWCRRRPRSISWRRRCPRRCPIRRPRERPSLDLRRASTSARRTLQPGNSINLTYTDTATNTQRQISIVNVTASGALPLQNGANANPLLVGVNFLARHDVGGNRS